MKCSGVSLVGCVLLSWLVPGCALGADVPWRQLAAPEVGPVWVQPAQGSPAQPIWGYAKGLRVGLPPTRGPRGLLRIYAPYLGHDEGRVINFVAVEPIPRGQTDRGLSELERSALDNVRGKRLWSVDTPIDPTPKPAVEPARGVVEAVSGVETLTVFIPVERFENGAHVYLRLRFRADRPEEVGIATFAWKDSVPLEHCVVTATMGNYARLRALHLRGGTKTAGELWPDYRGDGFSPHMWLPLADLPRTADGAAMLVATPNEAQPERAEYAPGTRPWWRYKGKVATQYWRCPRPDPALMGLVNGRYMYWSSKAPIPGGISFENVELMEPFRNGAEYSFGVTTKTPVELIEREGVARPTTRTGG